VQRRWEQAAQDWGRVARAIVRSLNSATGGCCSRPCGHERGVMLPWPAKLRLRSQPASGRARDYPDGPAAATAPGSI